MTEAVLAAVRRLGSASCPQIAASAGVPRTSALPILARLKDDGKVTCRGEGKATRYSVALLPRVAAAALSPRQEQALAHVQRTGRITRAEYAALVGVSIRTATRDLAEMVDGGLLRSEGSGNKAGYVIV